MKLADLFRVGRRKSRDAPTTGYCSIQGWETLCRDGYKPLTECPEVQMCVRVYADLISSMTLHLMQNTQRGDIRIINELSRKMDIDPNRHLTRTPLISLIVSQLLLHGNQVTFPTYRGDYLDNLKPLPMGNVSFHPQGDTYNVQYHDRVFNPDMVLHFVLNPSPDEPWRGTGYRAELREVVDSIQQTEATKKELLQNPGPSIIVKVDGLTEEFSSRDGRKKLAEQYWDANNAAEPWFIPADAFAVEQIRPLTIADLAIKDTLELDKRRIAAIFGVPAFLLGVGEFNRAEFNFFLSTRVLNIVKIIEQELTRKLLYSPDLYWRFNVRSLYAYEMSELINIGTAMVDRMAMTRNEWRDLMSMAPLEGMDELLGLENYLPVDRLGDQKKLNDEEAPEGKGGENDDET